MPINSFEHYPMSWRPKINKTRHPLYKTIAYTLEKDIKNGMLLPNDKLPPQRELADYLDVNLSTIARAFKLCETKGLISGRIGQGTYVSSDVIANAPMLEENSYDDIEFIDLGASHPLTLKKDYISQILKKLPTKINIENLMEYHHIAGSYTQKQSGMLWLQKFGIHVDMQDILLTAGLQNSLAIILSSLFSYGDKIATNSIIYPGFKNLANMLGIQLIPIPYQKENLDLDYLEYLGKSKQLKGIYLISDMQNPTTITMSVKERQAICLFIQKYSLIGIEDGTYSFLNIKKLPSLHTLAPEHVIHICTVSNSLSAGLRISYLVTPKKFKSSLLEGIQNINVMSSPLDAEIVSQLIQTNLADTILKEKISELQARNTLVDELLCDYTIWGHKNCQFRWLLLPKHLNSHIVESLLFQKKVKVFCSDRFLVGNATCSPALRLAISSPKEQSTLHLALSTIQTELNKL